MKPEIHLFILWDKARVVQDRILDDIALHFTILKTYEITWTPSLVVSNFTRFCGTRLGNSLQYKIDDCGIGEFLVVVVRDNNPIYENKKTFHGPADVNIKMFEAKQRYRDWTGGGIRVHATDNIIETNHDLTLLIGKNANDFEATCKDSKVEKLHRDLEGANGWESIQQLFYVLNNTVRYAVMRGYGELSSGEFINHGDTDIMTDDYENMNILLNAPVYHNIRHKALISIKEQKYLLDIWDCSNTGRNYFDPVWVQEMLRTSINWNGLQVLNPQNDFYCLLYHCLINKGYIADDYMKKLMRYKREFGIIEEDWNKILVAFLRKMKYEIIRPTDTENPFRLSNLDIAEYALRNSGVCVFSNVNLKVYEKENILIINSISDFTEVEKDALLSSLKLAKREEPYNKSLKAFYKSHMPKRIQRYISKIRKFIKCKK